MTELTLFDDDIDVLRNTPVGPAIVYDLANRRQGHLRIDGPAGSMYFVNMGSVVSLGPMAGPTVDLTADQLRIIGDYCHRMADRIEASGA